MPRGTTLALVLALVAFGAAALGVGGCVIVPRYQREAFAHPAMDASGTQLEDRSLNKLHTAREVASGGNGRPAGGGCACSN